MVRSEPSDDGAMGSAMLRVELLQMVCFARCKGLVCTSQRDDASICRFLEGNFASFRLSSAADYTVVMISPTICQRDSDRSHTANSLTQSSYLFLMVKYGGYGRIPSLDTSQTSENMASQLKPRPIT